MKRIYFIFLSLLILCSCSIFNNPSSKVEEYLNNYVYLSDNIIADMESKISDENLSSENQTVYKDILMRQYKDMQYQIKDESINGDEATVSVRITVYDLYGNEKKSYEYLNEHLDEFYDINNQYDNELYVKYKLSKMLEVSDTVDYDIDFYLTKENGDWILKEPNREVLEKIHGMYDYDND